MAGRKASQFLDPANCSQAVHFHRSVV